jgi:hypothetical protein
MALLAASWDEMPGAEREDECQLARWLDFIWTNSMGWGCAGASTDTS